MKGHTTRATALLLVATWLLMIQDSVAFERKYETPGNLRAAKILPADLVKGEHHEVDHRVRNDGYLNYYTIRSDFGEYEAASTGMLGIRVHEIGALAELDELSRTEVFIKAAAEAGVAPIKGVKQFVTHPVKTITGIPRGIGRMFRRYTGQASDAAEAGKEFVAGEDEEDAQEHGEQREEQSAPAKLTESYFGVSSAERAWAQKLGTDPYSTNKTLRDAIKSVAWAERLGKFGVGFAGLPEIPGADIIGKVTDAVWNMDAYELRDLNRKRLIATGADEALIDEYIDNARLTPTLQTLLTAAIAELQGVEGRDGILSQSLNLRTEAEARFFVMAVTLLAWYHRNQMPFALIITNAAVPAGVTASDTFVLQFAADHVYWTEEVAEAATGYTSLLEAGPYRSREVWFLGTATERCRQELSALGWSVHENVARLLNEERT